jgi:hypothetical protein
MLEGIAGVLEAADASAAGVVTAATQFDMKKHLPSHEPFRALSDRAPRAGDLDSDGLYAFH